jgi:hypothetical protein
VAGVTTTYFKGRILGTKEMTTPPSNLDILAEVEEMAMQDGDHPP